VRLWVSVGMGCRVLKFASRLIKVFLISSERTRKLVYAEGYYSEIEGGKKRFGSVNVALYSQVCGTYFRNY
jgi:hypothetical protein